LNDREVDHRLSKKETKVVQIHIMYTAADIFLALRDTTKVRIKSRTVRKAERIETVKASFLPGSRSFHPNSQPNQ